jgi:hypothetical protein
VHVLAAVLLVSVVVVLCATHSTAPAVAVAVMIAGVVDMGVWPPALRGEHSFLSSDASRIAVAPLDVTSYFA